MKEIILGVIVMIATIYLWKTNLLYKNVAALDDDKIVIPVVRGILIGGFVVSIGAIIFGIIHVLS
jgi:hypothetical protein